jgi:hypothetical protein
MAYDACERLWPLVRDPETRDEAVFTMAYCFERANNLPTAAFLYGWVADRHPEFNVAARRLQKCRDALDEDFNDSGHVDCPCGNFRYRAELGLCPYCGKTTAERPESGTPEAEDAASSSASIDPTTDVFKKIRLDLDRVWKTIQDKFDEFKQRDDLTGPAQHAQVLAKEISERVRKFSESETGQGLRRAAGDAREKTTEQLRAASEREDVQQARTHLEEWTRDAADRIEEFARSERVQSAGRTAYDVLERLVGRVQGYIDRALGRAPAETEQRVDPSRDPETAGDEESRGDAPRG